MEPGAWSLEPGEWRMENGEWRTTDYLLDPYLAYDA